VAGVIIGVDPHKGSHTAVALDGAEKSLGQLRVKATPGQVDQLLRWSASWPDRTWAIEGARGLGQLLAQQLIGAGEKRPRRAAQARRPGASAQHRAGQQERSQRRPLGRRGRPSHPRSTSGGCRRRHRRSETLGAPPP
jgi:hypothetical protein